MGLAENRSKSQAYAKYMADHGIRRTDGNCPWGCGRLVKNGGGPLSSHLNTCKGKRSKARKVRA